MSVINKWLSKVRKQVCLWTKYTRQSVSICALSSQDTLLCPWHTRLMSPCLKRSASPQRDLALLLFLLGLFWHRTHTLTHASGVLMIEGLCRLNVSLLWHCCYMLGLFWHWQMHTSGPLERLCTLQERHELANVCVPTNVIYRVTIYWLLKNCGEVFHAGQAAL